MIKLLYKKILKFEDKNDIGALILFNGIELHFVHLPLSLVKIISRARTDQALK